MADRVKSEPPPENLRDTAPPAENGGAGSKRGKPILYVGRISSQTGRRDLEDLFSRYGKVVALEIKHGGYGFVEFEDLRDAEDAHRALNNYRLDGSDLIVEFSRRSGPGESTCFICGRGGHWARDCDQSLEKGMDVKSGKCFKCGDRGHLARYCRGPGGPPPGPPRHYATYPPPPYGDYGPYYPPPPPRGYYRDDYYRGGPYRSPPRHRSRSPGYRGGPPPPRGPPGGYGRDDAPPVDRPAH
ncbi:RNA-binding domain-containing protein [Gonapodya prolifera JEL478]|uniref:RNA-binding domain-containing protein n=1 Tax=Gonapodya prolifera (strain JEL478) TaxID=1344416 RepID=A0A139ALK3_GONPJ|nr:RNA-binding domain-containing protein [Gonapodya prolifera JEL478]|eukprot:KXS17305.1 RNA-binding domain-containing protein [Gonapodya prolifera JEL478]